MEATAKKQDRPKPTNCPECGTALKEKNGCFDCPKCGWGICM